MSRKLIVALAVASLAFVGMSFAAVENIKVSGDINLESVTRDFALGGTVTSCGSKPTDHEFLISQIRLRFDADLTEGVSAVIRLISERTWGEDNSKNSNGDAIELDLGYIELKEFFYQQLTVIVGRQNLRYGNAFIVGDPDTNQGILTTSGDNDSGLPSIATDLSLRKSFDAARAILDFAPWTIDLVFAQVDENTTNERKDDEHLMGFNAAYDWSSYNGVTEVYFFKGDNTPRSTATDTKDHVYVTGLRTQFDPTDKITLGIEGAYQFGDYRVSNTDKDHVRAWAGQVNGEYRFLNDYNAKIGAGYTYLSGDSTSSTEKYGGWNPMWEDQTPAEIINVLMENSNAHYARVTGSMMPREDVTLGLVYCHARLDKTLNATTYSSSTNPGIIGPIRDLSYTYQVNTDKKHFGDEVDVYGVYDYTEDVQLKLIGAFFIPGTVFTGDNDDLAYSVRAGLSVDF